MLHVAANWPARVVRIVGCLVPGLWAAGASIRSPDGAPFDAVLFAAFAFAFVAVTARTVSVAPRAIATGAVVGVSAALLPALVLAIRPPVPATGDWAFVVVVVAAAIAVRLNDYRSLNGALSGLLAAVITALLIVPVLSVMAKFGPESWVPRIVSHALTPADQVGERRHLAGEPYMPVLLFGAALAVLLGLLAMRARGRTRVATRVRLADGPRPIELGEV